MAQLSGIVTVFEKALKGIISKSGGVLDWNRPQYTITRLGQGQYDITLSLSGLGVQHVYLSVVGDDLTIKGKIALIGTNPSFPFSLIQELINETVKTWLEKGLDSFSASTPGTAIKLAQSEPLKLDYAPVALMSPMPVAVPAKPVVTKVVKAIVKG